MTQFINSRENAVTEAIDGLIQASGGALAKLDGFPHIKVVVRNDWDKSKVAIVCGGGSGHEPSHAGFVGQGMLTAAVCGDIFASPSVDAVLAGILAVIGSSGCLLVLKNYTGDRLNFGLAAERARAMGLKVNMLIVGDDIALPDLAQPRGLAGTLLVNKVAGALAESGASLDEVTAAAQKVSESALTIGMSLDTCTIPGTPKEARISENTAELGLGIHNEPGAEQIDYSTADAAIKAVSDKMAPLMGDTPHVALLNNLGGASVLEMSVLANALAHSSIADKVSDIVGPASLMTSLDMHGFSLTVVPASAADIAHLDAPCAPAAWPGCKSFGAPQTQPMPEGLALRTFKASTDEKNAQILDLICKTFIASEAELNTLDAKSGDGDTGSTLAGAARGLASAQDRLPMANTEDLFGAIGQELGQIMGGSSGVLLAIFFTAAGEAAATGASLQGALQAGLERMKSVGGAAIGDRTMIDALEPALVALNNGLGAAAQAARTGADSTAAILQAKAGRASYVGAAQLEGHRDPGAQAVALMFEALSQ
ncbi:dihydroxyacetone kinase subunit DhaK [Planktotalea sp.]|uniref:dihydroxyacetone kinase subunit DhaK n=1 Tax=Planktotalea sp. TaxID=2029877 RepID=UPI0025F4F62A|nr:dihydroxyacetone kinase subunit DhaK [Planktotalea sp.]